MKQTIGKRTNYAIKHKTMSEIFYTFFTPDDMEKLEWKMSRDLVWQEENKNNPDVIQRTDSKNRVWQIDIVSGSVKIISNDKLELVKN